MIYKHIYISYIINKIMCGIWIYLHKLTIQPSLTYDEMYNAFMKIEARGPDKSVLLKQSKYGLYIGFHRLCIMDTTSKGDQPFVLETEKKNIYVICNGEIYNFKELCEKYNIILNSGSDCEVLIHLYQLIGIDVMIKELIGEFAFCICEIDNFTHIVKLIIGRDQSGIRPLFITGNDDELVITSELKGSPFLDSTNYNIIQFPPRHYLEINNNDDKIFDPSFSKLVKYRDFRNIERTIYDLELAKTKIRQTFIETVKCRMISDRPLGCLLSGGLDSSLVASIASIFCKEKGMILKTFSIGMAGSTDEYYAKLVAKHIGSNHTHIELPEKTWLDAIQKVVEVIESYDITTVRASTGQYLVSKWISENTDIKVLLIGDGSDELCSGYMYFHKAPDPELMHLENIRLIEDIHFYDVLRADRGISANGLEARVPFLDHRFIELYLSIDPILRMPATKGLEKWFLRESFSENDYLPIEVLLRPKEAFSDGCSSSKRSWYSIIQEYINNKISDEELNESKKKYIHCIPPSKESLYFRKVFESYFGIFEETAKVIPYLWLPKWVGNISEPSARVLDVYKKWK